MGVEPQADDRATIELGIAKFIGWLQLMRMPTTLTALGAADRPIDAIARHCCRKGPVGHLKPLAAEDVEAILEGAR